MPCPQGMCFWMMSPKQSANERVIIAVPVQWYKTRTRHAHVTVGNCTCCFIWEMSAKISRHKVVVVLIRVCQHFIKSSNLFGFFTASKSSRAVHSFLQRLFEEKNAPNTHYIMSRKMFMFLFCRLINTSKEQKQLPQTSITCNDCDKFEIDYYDCSPHESRLSVIWMNHENRFRELRANCIGEKQREICIVLFSPFQLKMITKHWTLNFSNHSIDLLGKEQIVTNKHKIPNLYRNDCYWAETIEISWCDEANSIYISWQ